MSTSILIFDLESKPLVGFFHLSTNISAFSVECVCACVFSQPVFSPSRRNTFHHQQANDLYFSFSLSLSHTPRVSLSLTHVQVQEHEVSGIYYFLKKEGKIIELVTFPICSPSQSGVGVKFGGTCWPREGELKYNELPLFIKRKYKKMIAGENIFLIFERKSPAMLFNRAPQNPQTPLLRLAYYGPSGYWQCGTTFLSPDSVTKTRPPLFGFLGRQSVKMLLLPALLGSRFFPPPRLFRGLRGVVK